MPPRFAKFAPWVHALLVGLSAGLAWLVATGGRLNEWNVWAMFGMLVASRILGALVSAAQDLPRRRQNQTQLLEELAILTRRLIGATHGLSNQASIIIGEIDLLLERYNGGKAKD